jgi:hypothetical protein
VKTIASLLAVAAVVACSDAFTPNIENVAGTYRLQTLITRDILDTTDWVAAGATLSLTLDANGTTAGHIFAPGAGAGGSDFDADLAGTWNLTGDKVTFTNPADTFLRDMTFTAGENRLSGDQVFGGTRVTAVLAK